MRQNTKGAAAVLLAAFTFGITPILGRLSYEGGSNAVMLSMARSAMALPLLLVLHRIRGLSLKIRRRTVIDVLIMGILGSAVYAVLYNTSYSYIPVGLATVLTSTYPFFVMLFSALIFRERPGRAAVLALGMALCGVVLFTGPTAGAQLTGVLLAMGSALTYGWAMLFQYRSTLIKLHPFTLTFYLCATTCLSMLVYGALTGQITFRITASTWVYTFLIAVSSSVIGMSLLHYGLSRIGSVPAAILCMFEPITGVAVGVLLLGEPMTAAKFAGCGLVLAAITILTVSPRQPGAADVEDADEREEESV